jgi:hypothetical protein
MSEDKELRIPVRIRATGLIMSIMGTIRPERWGHS